MSTSNPPPGVQVFEAFWAPRWFGQDQSVAHGQEGDFDVRGPFPAPSGGFVVMATALDRPRHRIRCRVIGLKHDALGRLQAIVVDGQEYRFVLHSGDVVVVRDAGAVVSGIDRAPADWTIRVTLQLL